MIDKSAYRAIYVALFLFLFGSVCAAEAADLDPAQASYLSELIEKAKNKGLAEHNTWHTLLHYQPRLLFAGVESLADDSRFFNSPLGKRDPEDELRATLRAFFQNSIEDEEHPQCRFIARYHWLRDELEFDPQKLPEQSCPRYDEWFAAMSPQRITLVFPASYMNNPASMYGHSFLRIDGSGQDAKTRFLAYGASYSAVAGSDGGIAFAFKGLFGGYYGTFALRPYYEQVKTYSDLESRDIWEYELSLNAEETERAVKHLWELRNTKFVYYFFDENCAYHILSLLEFARPGLKLSEQYYWYAIPSDTVQGVAQTPGLVDDVVYRPSLATSLRYHFASFTPKELSLTKNLTTLSATVDDDDFRQLSAGSKAKVLEASAEYLNYLVLTGEYEEGEAAQFAHRLMLERSSIPLGRQLGAVPTPAVRPDDGHEVARLGVGLGFERNRGVFSDYRIRPAYHDLLSPQEGYLPGAEINFFDLAFRHYEEQKIELQHLFPIEITSLVERDDFFSPISWRGRAGVVRKRIRDASGSLVAQGRGGFGLAYRPVKQGLVYGLGESSFEFSPRYASENFAIGFGGIIGGYFDLKDSYRLHPYASVMRYGLGDEHTTATLALEQRYTIYSNLDIRFNIARSREVKSYWTDFIASVNYYF
jgi:hypothetical protein